MYSIKNLLSKNPIQISAAVMSLVNLLLIVHVVDWSQEAIAAGNVALITVLGLFIVQNTVNSKKLSELQEALPTATLETFPSVMPVVSPTPPTHPLTPVSPTPLPAVDEWLTSITGMPETSTPDPGVPERASRPEPERAKRVKQKTAAGKRVRK